jgi:signal transduction histidine kinase
MEFAKPRSPEPVTQTLRDVLDSLRQHWQQATSLEDRQFQVRQADPDLTVYGDPDQLREILDAVVANAVQATIPQTARLLINSPSVASDDKVRIVIEDNGRGMTREVLERALDPFFSVRPAGRGRGLGLSRAYRLAELNGGRLWLDSTPNVGTTATVELPARSPSS